MPVVQIKDKVSDFVSSEQVIDKITKVFQVHSYDAVTTDQISCETGISAADLRQQFPDGKQQMVTAILERADNHFRKHILSPLTSKNKPSQRIAEMAEQVKRFYQNGYGSCLFETLSIGNGQEDYKTHLSRSFTTWCTALVAVACESGFSRDEAQQRAEQALVSIEGSLVFTRITGNNKAFQKSLDGLPCLLTGMSC